MSRVRVLHVIQNLHYGGMERVLADLVMGADRSRFETHVLCLQFLGRYATGLQEVATLHVADPLPRYSMLWPGPLIRQIKRIAPDVVHLHSGVWYKASLAARLAGMPRVVYTEHGRKNPDPWQDRLVGMLAARRTDRVIAVSDPLRQQLEERLHVPSRRLSVIHNGVDTRVYSPRADTGVIRRELGLAAETPIVGSIGRLEPIKGYDVMIEAFALLRRGWSDGPAPVLVVAGSGSARPAVESLVRERGLAGSAHLLGWRDDVDDLRSCFTLFTMSSRSEGTSISLLEAMSGGLCPVVTQVGGNADVLGAALQHRLVPAEHPAALAAAWREALTDVKARQRDGAAARERVQREFSVEAMVRAYEVAYTG